MLTEKMQKVKIIDFGISHMGESIKNSKKAANGTHFY